MPRASPSLFVRIFVWVVSVLVTIGALPARTRLAVPLPTPPLPAIRATLVAAFVPHRGRDDLHDLYSVERIIAGDDQVAGPGEFFAGAIAQDDVQRGAGMESGGEWIVDEFPMSIGMAECNARDVESAVADVADREGPFGGCAGRHAAEERRARYGQLACA